MKKAVILLLALLFSSTAAYGIFNSTRSYVLGHITTCTGFINNYPADSTNWFYRKTHNVVQYFAYLLFPTGTASGFAKTKKIFENPYEIYSGSGKFKSEDSFVFENKWIAPSGKVICEKTVQWDKNTAGKKVEVDGVSCVAYIFANYIGIVQAAKDNGQEALPEETGLYHIELYVNGELAAVTFFEMKD